MRTSNPRHASSFPRRVRPIRIGLPGTDGLRRNAPSPSVGLQILACKKLSSSQRYVNDSIAECLCHPRRQCLRQQQDCPAAHGVRPSSAATPVLDPLPRCDRDGRCTATLWRRCVRHSAQITSSRSMRTAAHANETGDGGGACASEVDICPQAQRKSKDSETVVI